MNSWPLPLISIFISSSTGLGEARFPKFPAAEQDTEIQSS